MSATAQGARLPAREAQLMGAGARATLARLGAYAMTWIYAALCRALIPVIWATLVALVFFVVPQTREVLHGLSEPLLGSPIELEVGMDGVNDAGIFWYLVTAVMLAGALWYSARLLLERDRSAFRPRRKTLYGFATVCTWLPRGLGVFSLSASVGALIYANYRPPLEHLAALALAALCIIAPLSFFGLLARSMCDNPPMWLARRKLLWLGIAAAAQLLSAALLATRAGNDDLTLLLWCVAASQLPAGLLSYQIVRRNLIDRRDAAAQSAANHRRIWWQAMTLVLLSLTPFAFLALAPPAWIRTFGTAAAVQVFGCAAVVFLAFLQLTLRRIARDVPGLTAAVLIVSTAAVWLFGRESLGVEKLERRSPPAAAIALPVSPASESGADLYVNAHGGGLRAALFTAEALALADDRTCGEFGDRLAALSGVSGGSLGIAVYLLARQEHRARNPLAWSENCLEASPRATPLTNLVRHALVQDHLSTAIARMLAIDALPEPFPPARGQALLQSWQSALASALASDAHAAPTVGFNLPLGELTGGLPSAPQVYFNATDADSGHIVWFSNRDRGLVGAHAPARTAAAGDISVGQAVLHSARFPLITPAGAYIASWEKDSSGAQLRLVDGGYADNSGAVTLGQMRPDGRSWLINIDGNPPLHSTCHDPTETPPIVTAVRALLQSRVARAEHAVADMKGRLPKQIELQLDLERAYGDCEKVRRAHAAPLGWYMSYAAAAALSNSVTVSVTELCGKLPLECAAAPVYAQGDSPKPLLAKLGPEPSAMKPSESSPTPIAGAFTGSSLSP